MIENPIQVVQSEETLRLVTDLRYRVLRAPWNQSYESARDDLESHSVNAFISNGTRVVACGRIHEVAPTVAQIRYMAVDDAYRGQGLGARILKFLESTARESGYKKIILQARENAVPFYEAHHYTKTEKTFLLWGEVQHYLMEKILD